MQNANKCVGNGRLLKKNENITIQHIDDDKSEFSSIKRLKIYDKSQTSPIESISYEFNILAKLPNIEKPQPYKITVRISSSIAMLKKMANDVLPGSIFRLFSAGNIVVEIEYIDYVVARSMISTIDSWVREIEIPAKFPFLRFFQRYSHWIPRFTSGVIFGLSFAAALTATDAVFQELESNKTLAKFLLTSFSVIVVASTLAGWIGRFMGSSVDRIKEISCIVINRGDERLEEKYKRKNIFL